MPRKYNLLKIRALTVFENRGWLSPPAWAVLTSFYPVRAAYSYWNNPRLKARDSGSTEVD